MTPRPRAASSTRGRRRRPSKGDLKEAAILDTAWNLLAEKPLPAITIEDLAQGAGISRSNFYFYFDSKDAAVRALAERVGDEIRAAAAPFFGGGDGTDLRQAVAGYMRRWRERGAALRAMTVHSEGDVELREFWDRLTDELLDEIAASLDNARRAGVAHPAPPASKDLVRVLFGMLWRAGYELSLRPMSPEDEERLVDTLTTVCYRSILGTDPPATSAPPTP